MGDDYGGYGDGCGSSYGYGSIAYHVFTPLKEASLGQGHYSQRDPVSPHLPLKCGP